MQNFDERGADAMEAGLRAAKLTPMQVRIFWIAFERALGLKPLTIKEIKTMMHHTAWEQIDKGLKDLMVKNDELSLEELKAKSKRLKCLADFSETLRQRVNERVRGVAVGDIEPLFQQFFTARNQVDETTN